jgi:hypothetical protein
MTDRTRLIAMMLLCVTAALPGAARAACTEKDQEAKVNTLSGLVAGLAQKNDPRAQAISGDMQSAMMQEGDEACATLDKLIDKAK